MCLKSKILILCFFALPFVMLPSCKKNNGLVNNGQRYLVKTYTEPNDFLDPPTVTISYTYDSSGRVISSSDGYNYNYQPGLVVKTLSGNTDIDSFILNNQNLAIQTKRHGGFYTYDNNGYLIHDSSTNSISTYTEDFTISGGNVISERTNYILLSNNSITPENYTFTYYNEFDSRNFGLSFLGRQSNNLIKTQTSSSGWVGTYTYVFDAQGRVIKATETYSGTPPTSAAVYQYSY